LSRFGSRYGDDDRIRDVHPMARARLVPPERVVPDRQGGVLRITVKYVV
jgi:hypothetical protein